MTSVKGFLLSWGLVVLSALFDCYAAFVVKAKFNELGRIDYSSLGNLMGYLIKFVKSPLLLTAVITFITAPGLWFFALNRLDLSVGYPALVGFHLLFALVFGIFLLGESMSLNKGIAVTLIFVSLFFLNR